MIEWTDSNGNIHSIDDRVELRLQQPNCKYLLPCGLCTLTSSLSTCYLLKGVKKND